MSDSDAVRRWTRILSTLRARRAKRPRPDPAAREPIDELLDESLETCRGLLQDLAGTHLLCDQLRREVHAEAGNRQHLLDRMPVACIITDEASVIRNANQRAAELFNVSSRHLRGRMLLHFSADRAAFGSLLQHLPVGGGRADASVEMRPRERGPFTIHMLIVPETVADHTSWLWFMNLVGAGNPAMSATGSTPAKLATG